MAARARPKAGRNPTPISDPALDLQQYRQLGALGSLVWALPPVQRTFLRHATGIAILAATARETDRKAFVRLIDAAFDEIEAAQAGAERRA